MIFSQQGLRSFGLRPVTRTFSMVNESLEGLYSRKEKYIFLSHSNQDSDLAKGFVNQAHELGIHVYFDLYDSTLTLPPSSDTAMKLRNRIHAAAHFILLATKNSVAGSRWCPWELGCADGFHVPISIAQTSDESGREWGAEYLQLYNSIEIRTDSGYRQRLARMRPRGKYDTMSSFENWFDSVML